MVRVGVVVPKHAEPVEKTVVLVVFPDIADELVLLAPCSFGVEVATHLFVALVQLLKSLFYAEDTHLSDVGDSAVL